MPEIRSLIASNEFRFGDLSLCFDYDSDAHFGGDLGRWLRDSTDSETLPRRQFAACPFFSLALCKVNRTDAQRTGSFLPSDMGYVSRTPALIARGQLHLCTT